MTSQAPRRVLVTSGPTRAYFDRIRYIANTSSGALGAAVVGALAGRGIAVTHLVGEGAIRYDGGAATLVETVPVSTVDDVVAAVGRAAGGGDVGAVVHAMAVLDYVPEARLAEKKKSGDEHWDVRLVRTPKVIGMLRGLFPAAFLVGFKLEAGIGERELISRARVLMAANRLDLAVANDLDRVAADRHEALVIQPDGTVVARPSTKHGIAETLAAIIAEHIG